MVYPKHTHLWPENYETDHEIFWKEMNEENKLTEAILALDKIKQLIDDLPGGCSWYGDAEWGEHFADFGYILPFLDELLEYLQNRKKNITAL